MALRAENASSSPSLSSRIPIPSSLLPAEKRKEAEPQRNDCEPIEKRQRSDDEATAKFCSKRFEEKVFPAVCKWQMINEVCNDTDIEIGSRFIYRVGMRDLKEEKMSEGERHSMELKIGGSFPAFVNASITYQYTDSKDQSETKMYELTRSVESQLEFKVPPHKKLFIWQPMAQRKHWTAMFEAVHVTEDEKPPSKVINGTVTFLKIRKIGNKTPIRIKHKKTGSYLNTINYKGSEVATLGESPETHFKLFRTNSDDDYVRIEIVKPIFAEQKYAYSDGKIKFLEQKNEGKQLWKMSLSHPADGDTVTFRSKEWPTAGLAYCQDKNPSVHCEYANNLDQWVLEIA